MNQRCGLPFRLAISLRSAADQLETARSTVALNDAAQTTIAAWEAVRTAKTDGCKRLRESQTRLGALAGRVLADFANAGRIAPTDAEIETVIQMSRHLADSLTESTTTDACPVPVHPDGSAECLAPPQKS